MSAYPFQFEAQVLQHHLGTYRYTVVYLPRPIAAALPFKEHPRLRVSGEVGDVPFNGAWQPSFGDWYLMLSKPLLKAAELSVGDWTEVRFRLEDQNTVEVAPELVRVLEECPKARAAWDGLTPGKQRALSHRVLSGKTAPTRMRRLQEVVDVLAHGEGAGEVLRQLMGGGKRRAVEPERRLH